MNGLTTLTNLSFQGTKTGCPSLITPFGKQEFADEIQIQGFPSVIYDTPPTWKKVLKAANETFRIIEKQFYKYLKLAAKILKTVLKVVVLVYSELEDKVGQAIAYLGLISILKPFFNAKSLYDTSRDLEKSITLKDDEGIAWSSIELFVTPCEMANCLISFGKSLDTIIRIPWISLFSAVAVPLAIGLICYDTVKSLYKMSMISYEFSHMPHSAAGEHYTDFRIFLEKKVGITPQELRTIKESVQKKYQIIIPQDKKTDSPIFILPNVYGKSQRAKGIIESLEKEAKQEINKRVETLKDRKINLLRRRTNKKIAKYMRNVNEFLEEYPGKQHTAEKALEDIRKLMIRKLTLNVGKALFCVVEAVMYIASLIFPSIPSAIPVAFSLAKTCFSICKSIYNDYGMSHGLNNPLFLNPKSKSENYLFSLIPVTL